LEEVALHEKKLEGINVLEKLLTRREAAAKSREYGDIYAVAETTLAKLAGTGGGPPFVKCGRRVGYRENEFVVWLQSRMDLRSSCDRMDK
jgi:uncharacterized protein YceH (UPF0502 family)